jgi:3-methyl-2-oxobutanoate hydroxymethyltransferase
MGHLGLTPQSIHRLGGHRVQGRDETTASRILAEARALQNAARLRSCWRPYLRHSPNALRIASRFQPLVSALVPTAMAWSSFSMISWGSRHTKWRSFVKEYATLGPAIVDASRRFADEISEGIYPEQEHSYR